jgi:sugar phosphate isomerase/epimerase
MKAKIGLSMLFCLSEPFSKLLRHIDSVNVSHVEIVDEGLHALNTKRINAIKAIAEHRSLKLSLHAPFADINIASPNPHLRRTMLKRLEKSIAYAHELGCETWVFHSGLKTGVSFFYPGLDWRINLESTKKLLRTAEKFDVKIAVENTPEPYPFLLTNVKDFFRFFSEINDNSLGLALDVGHANINKQIYNFLECFSDKIVHVHVSDNDGRDDSHLGISYGTIEWQKVAASLKKCSVPIVLESVTHVKESLEKMRELFA